MAGEPVPGWFWVPGVPGVAWPGCVEEFGLLLLGVEEPGLPLLGVEVCGVLLLGVDERSGPPPVDVDGVVVGVPVDGDAALGGVDWAGFWFGVVVLGLWPGVWVRVPLFESALLRGVLPSLGLVFVGLLRG